MIACTESELAALRREAYGELADPPARRVEPRKFTVPADNLEPLAAKVLANEAERIADGRKRKRRLKEKGKPC